MKKITIITFLMALFCLTTQAQSVKLNAQIKTQRLFISKDKVNLAASDFATVAVAANCDYTATADQDWLTIRKTANGNTALFPQTNYDLAYREGTVTFTTADGTIKRTLKVRQDGYDATDELRLRTVHTDTSREDGRCVRYRRRVEGGAAHPERMSQRMAKVLLHFHAEQLEIGGIADDDGHIDTMLFVHFNAHRHVDHAGDAAAHAGFRHKRQPFHLVLEKPHGIIVLGGILDVIKIVRGGVHRPCQHVPHLHLHHQGHRDQEDRKDVLDHDENFVQNHLVPAPERALDHVDRFVTRGGKSREQAIDDAQDQNAGQIRQDIPRRHHEGKPHTGVAHQHQFVRVAVGDQAVHHRRQQIGQEERRREANGREGHGFADVLPQDAGPIGPQKAPGGHFLGPFSREGQAQVHIVEDGRQEEQQDDDGQQAQHLHIARASEPIAAAREEKGLVHAVRLPGIHFLHGPGGVVVLM